MNPENKETPRGRIISVVSRAPIFYLVFLAVGSALHYRYPVAIDGGILTTLAGAVFLFAGPLLILWSQASIRKFRTGVAAGSPEFSRGPYRFSRNPTYLGLVIMLSGFGLIANSFFIVLFSFLGFLAVNYIILRQEEKILIEKYGEDYRAYQSKVRRWL